jgi:1-acyl-sn-glycerol-3-phosphate acyltransferase
MIYARAALYNLYFYGLTFVMAFPAQLVRLAGQNAVYAYARFWAGLMVWGARVMVGIRVVVTGQEHLPAEGPALLASQHQSALDTLVWMTLLPRTSYVVKRELTRIPLFGPLLGGAGMISVDRAAGASALRSVLSAAAQARAEGRQIVIFPEGTRVPPGARVALQPGIAAIAARVNLDVIPVATDSGACWGRNAFMKYPGVVHIAIGAPIPQDTRRAEMLAAIEAHWRVCEAVGFRTVDNSVGSTLESLPHGLKRS